MADNRPSFFRFRLPWLQQAPTPTPAPQQPTQSPRTTSQTSVASASAQRPPFRPPGSAASVQAAPLTEATPAPASPRRSPPQSVPKSPIAETIEPVAKQPTEEKQTTTETIQTTETTSAKETQTTTETIPTIETLGPTTPPQTPPRQPQSQQPSPPKSPPQFQLPSVPVSPTRIRTPPQANSQSRSPSRMATQTKPSFMSSPEASPPRATSQPSSPTQTPPKSPSKTSSSPSTPEIKRSTEITKVKGTQTKSMNIPHSIETKSQKPKPKSASTRVALPREIKDDISKFSHKIATTSSSKQSMNEQPPNVITIAGDNKGAFMHLNSDAVKRDIKQDSKLGENEETKSIVNSNIQGIINSMMFNSSVTERNPGVHLVITRNLAADMNDAKMKNAESMEMQRAEFNVSPPKKVIYDPSIGRSMQDDYEPDDFETSANSNEIEVL